MANKKLLGLIVNPKAGLGGSVGLKGSDGEAIQRQALDSGAVLRANERAAEALAQLTPLKDKIQVVTYPAEMGADVARSLGFEVNVIGSITQGHTTSADTRNAAKAMLNLPVDLLLFTGGDGTARDVYDSIGINLPALGIPAGVKIHSPVYATHPKAAGKLAALFLSGAAAQLKEAEVMDIDEEALRHDKVSTRLYGYLKIPYDAQYVQSSKSSSPVSEQQDMEEIAAAVIKTMQADTLYILGPGTTTRAITSRLNLEKTLIGVDVVLNQTLLAKDVSEAQILSALRKYPRAKIIVTPIGGQGFIFGRGNQQISAQVIAKVGVENIIIVATTHKIVALQGRPLLVDTGDVKLDKKLAGYRQVLTRMNQKMVYRVSSHF